MNLTDRIADCLDHGGIDHPKVRELLIDARNELRDMTAWKDSAYKTIYEIADAAYGREWSGGKTQDEIIGQVKRLKGIADDACNMEHLRDTTRLDWLEQSQQQVTCWKCGPGTETNPWTIGDLDNPAEGDTVRAVIDAAMQRNQKVDTTS